MVLWHQLGSGGVGHFVLGTTQKYHFFYAAPKYVILFHFESANILEKNPRKKNRDIVSNVLLYLPRDVKLLYLPRDVKLLYLPRDVK